jgi:hypothetical protein
MLRSIVEETELQRDDEHIEKLRTYITQCPELFPFTKTLSEGLLEKLVHYLGSADDEAKSSIRKKYQALWEVLIQENTCGIVGLLLIKEILLAALLLEFCTEKFVRFYAYASGGKEGRLMEAVQSRYLKSLRMFQKLNGKLPDIEYHLTQMNIGK